MRLFLIGYMGVGKTTIGRELAKTLNIEFIDLDHFIQNRYSKEINQIFKDEGESRFREIENKILKEVSSFENVLISTGGGTPCFFDSMDVMNKRGLTIYMKSSPELLAKRLMISNKDKRPLLKDKTETELLQFVRDSLIARELYYNQAQIILESDELVNKLDVGRYIIRLQEKIDLYNAKEKSTNE